MVKIRGAAFATLDYELATLRMAQQIKIAAAHEAKTRSHQADRAVTDVVCLPGRTGWNASRAEQGPCDVSVGFATLMGVERTQDEGKTLTPLQADGVRRAAGRSAHRYTP